MAVFKLDLAILTIFLLIRTSLSYIDDQGNELWEPEDGRSRLDWIKCRGLSCKDWETHQRKMMKLKALELPDQDEDYYRLEEVAVKHPEELPLETILELDMDECEWNTEQEIDDNIESEVKGLGKDHIRHKRRFHGSFDNDNLKWDMPIRYKFDGSQSNYDKDMILRAIRHIQAQTCIRFEELKLKQSYPKTYLLFIEEYDRCHSWVGKQNMPVQPININEECVRDMGAIVHEILHSIGMWHEEQRSDRNDYVKINYQNLKNTRAQFTKKVDTQSMDIPYDYGSVMHYAPKDLSKNGRYVIEPKNPEDNLMKHTMGQRTGLSFYDTKLLNKAYCSDVCQNEMMEKPCEKRGYQHPNNCKICKCQNAYAGKFCEKIRPSNAECGGKMFVDNVEYISTPNYPTGHYRNRMSCTWHITSPKNTRLQFQFEGLFAIFHKNKGVCYHWVEVMYRGNLDKAGPRFCGYYRPLAKLTSDSNEMIVMLRSNYTSTAVNEREGFKAKIEVIKD